MTFEKRFVPEYEAPETRLPIQHPDYRYPESRNPYFAKVRELAGRVFTDNQTESRRAEWRAAFPDAARAGAERRPLHVEVGCNGGHVILEWAARDPRGAYVGVDWKFKQIHRGAEKALKRRIDNLLFFRANSERLHYMFGPGEIDFLYLFFPDPWAKKSQLKNRWLTADRLRQIAPLVRAGGVFHLKTDHAGYFDWMREAIDEVPELWEPFDESRDLHAGNPEAHRLSMPEVTLFERIFIARGIPIHQVKLRRRG